jgi:citrate lyase subunit beta/citryl-CoA lyase
VHRSYLFAPGDSEKLLAKVFAAGADAVILDLEDAVAPERKPAARRNIAEALETHSAWVRINASHTALAAADLDAVASIAIGIRIPKVESIDDVRWVAQRAPGKPLICAIETAKGVVNAFAIAAEPAVSHLALGGIDLRRDLGVGDDDTSLIYVRSHLAVACRAAGIGPPIDSVYPMLHDDEGLRRQCASSRALGFFGKSAIHPRQLPIIHEAFSPTRDELQWAQDVVDAFDAANGAASRLPGGEFVDLPVVERARGILLRAGAGDTG